MYHCITKPVVVHEANVPLYHTLPAKPVVEHEANVPLYHTLPTKPVVEHKAMYHCTTLYLLNQL